MIDAVWYGDKKPWLPSVQLCDGKKYVSVSKWNPGFVKFATGKCMERRRGKVQNTCNLAILDRLRAARKEACNARVQTAIEEAMAADQSLPDEPRKKKQRAQPARDCDHLMCGNVVTVIVDGYQMDVLWSVTSSVVWVEFLPSCSVLAGTLRHPRAVLGHPKGSEGSGCPEESPHRRGKHQKCVLPLLMKKMERQRMQLLKVTKMLLLNREPVPGLECAAIHNS